MNDKIKLIIAEDIDIIRERYVELLGTDEQILIVGECATGIDAVLLFKEKSADIILMDIEMETPTAGLEAAYEIQQISNDVKIIFLSVHEDSETILSSMAMGAVDYIVKTMDKEKILSHIKKAYQDKVELDMKIQKLMRDELIRLARNNTEIIKFTKIIHTLTNSEREILKLLLQGLSIKTIAEVRFVEVVTVKTQIGQLLRKFNVRRSKEIIKQIKELHLSELFL